MWMIFLLIFYFTDVNEKKKATKSNSTTETKMNEIKDVPSKNKPKGEMNEITKYEIKTGKFK